MVSSVLLHVAKKKERLTTVDAKSPPMALVIGTIERMGGTDETNYSKSWPVTNCRVALFNVERNSQNLARKCQWQRSYWLSLSHFLPWVTAHWPFSLALFGPIIQFPISNSITLCKIYEKWLVFRQRNCFWHHRSYISLASALHPSRGVDGIDEYDDDDDDGGGRRENMTICWPHTGLARPPTSVILWASCGPVESLQPSGRCSGQ